MNESTVDQAQHTLLESIAKMDLGLLTQQYIFRMDNELKEYNMLVDDYEKLQDLLVTARLEISQLKYNLKEALNGVAGNPQQQNRKLLEETTKRVKAEKELKALKAEGDIKGFKRRLKETKIKLDEKIRNFNLLSSTYNKEHEQFKEYQSKLELLEAIPLRKFADTGETLYLHPEKVDVKYQNNTTQGIIIKYWNPLGVGWLITWTGSEIRISDAGLSDIPSQLRPTQKVIDSCTNWFKKNVTIINNKQYLKGALANATIQKSA
jgi:hypothetical protein